MDKLVKVLCVFLLMHGMAWSSALQAQSLSPVSGATYDGEQISWESLPGATDYNVHYFYADGVRGWEYLTTIGNTNAFTPMLIGTYNVIAYDDAGSYSPFQIEGECPSSCIDITSLGEPEIGTEPTTPTTITTNEELKMVEGASFDGETITWNALANATGYNVHYFYDDGVRGWSYLTTVGNVNSFVPNLPGSYIIVGYDMAGNYSPFQRNGGCDSNCIRTTSISDNGTHEGPTTITGTSTVSNDIQLGTVPNVNYNGREITWDTLSGATGYNVHYAPLGPGGFQYLTTVGNVNAYTPTLSGTYVIVGYDMAGNYSPILIEGNCVDNCIIELDLSSQ